MGFKIWLEQSEAKRYVFLDMDQTLVHFIEKGWLKECPGNKDYEPLLIHGKPPYPEIKKIKDGGEEMHLFPRPRLKEFLENISHFADIYVLSHNKQSYLNKVVKAYDLGKWIKKAYSTRELQPDQLAKEFGLGEAKWVLVDNMNVDHIEMVHKLRILGLLYPNSKTPNEEGKKIVKDGREHFIHVKNWYPTVDEHSDNELFRVLPEIKEKLGVL